MTKLSGLIPDKRNANKGTAKGQKMIVSSIQQNGFGRSGLLDKHGNIVAGNKTTEAAAEVFGVDVEPVIVETDGKRPVYVKRVDLDLDDPDPNNPARRLAYQDNLASHFSFDLDPVQVMADIEGGFDFEAIDLGLDDLDELLKSTSESVLKERKEELRPKRFMRVLISIPVDSAILAKSYIDDLSKIPGIEVDYSAN